MSFCFERWQTPLVSGETRIHMRERGVSFKQALNEAIRAGLAIVGKQPRARRFAQQAFPLGAAQNFQWEKALAIADALEDEELTREQV